MGQAAQYAVPERNADWRLPQGEHAPSQCGPRARASKMGLPHWHPSCIISGRVAYGHSVCLSSFLGSSWEEGRR